MNTCLDVLAVKYVQDIPKSIYNRNHEKWDLKGNTICMTDSDHDYIVEYIEDRDKIEFERNLRGDFDEE